MKKDKQNLRERYFRQAKSWLILIHSLLQYSGFTLELWIGLRCQMRSCYLQSTCDKEVVIKVATGNTLSRSCTLHLSWGTTDSRFSGNVPNHNTEKYNNNNDDNVSLTTSLTPVWPELPAILIIIAMNMIVLRLQTGWILVR